MGREVIKEYETTINAADLGTTQYTDVLPMIFGEAGTYVTVIVQTISLAGGDGTSKVTAENYLMGADTDDPSTANKTQVNIGVQGDTADGAASYDCITGTSSVKRMLRPIVNRYSREVIGNFYVLALSNSGTAYTGGQVKVIIKVF